MKYLNDKYCAIQKKHVPLLCTCITVRDMLLDYNIGTDLSRIRVNMHKQ